jgi:hypothetical protein
MLLRLPRKLLSLFWTSLSHQTIFILFSNNWFIFSLRNFTKVSFVLVFVFARDRNRRMAQRSPKTLTTKNFTVTPNLKPLKTPSLPPSNELHMNEKMEIGGRCLECKAVGALKVGDGREGVQAAHLHRGLLGEVRTLILHTRHVAIHPLVPLCQMQAC